LDSSEPFFFSGGVEGVDEFKILVLGAGFAGKRNQNDKIDEIFLVWQQNQKTLDPFDSFDPHVGIPTT
jgi:hypothetical protein